jgi:hypothetical protein
MQACHISKNCPHDSHGPAVHHLTSLGTQKCILKVYGPMWHTPTSSRAAIAFNSFKNKLIHVKFLHDWCEILAFRPYFSSPHLFFTPSSITSSSPIPLLSLHPTEPPQWEVLC